ncbi:hypothetical protein EVAR_49963_1 [Eumeta japonica]|uniref:Uncharacterized protein n=1 Tax=Eumeta variegata TaxID=151549 RepID=A0A4C1YJ02_EUMVA|nr:hypothetical protein EVAR_49963_1 [Eumeta japonica]
MIPQKSTNIARATNAAGPGAGEDAAENGRRIVNGVVQLVSFEGVESAINRAIIGAGGSAAGCACAVALLISF